MNQRKNWQKLLALTLFVILLGGYYQQLNVEAKAMVLPLGIFIAAAVVIARFKQLEHEIRSLKVMAHGIAVQNISVIDSSGHERIAISSTSDSSVMTCYDDSHAARITLELLHQEPILKLAGDKGSAWITFSEDGGPNLSLKDDNEKTIWSAL